jgi:hypothetical protein
MTLIDTEAYSSHAHMGTRSLHPSARRGASGFGARAHGAFGLSSPPPSARPHGERPLLCGALLSPFVLSPTGRMLGSRLKGGSNKRAAPAIAAAHAGHAHA